MDINSDLLKEATERIVSKLGDAMDGFYPHIITVDVSNKSRIIASYRKKSQFQNDGCMIDVNVGKHLLYKNPKTAEPLLSHEASIEQLMISISYCYLSSVTELWRSNKLGKCKKYPLPNHKSFFAKDDHFYEDAGRFLVTYNTLNENFWDAYFPMLGRVLSDAKTGVFRNKDELAHEDMLSANELRAGIGYSTVEHLTPEQAFSGFSKGSPLISLGILGRKTLPRLSTEQIHALESIKDTFAQGKHRDTFSAWLSTEHARNLLSKHAKPDKKMFMRFK